MHTQKAEAILASILEALPQPSAKAPRPFPQTVNIHIAKLVIQLPSSPPRPS
jgi:hypothetical protein